MCACCMHTNFHRWSLCGVPTFPLYLPTASRDDSRKNSLSQYIFRTIPSFVGTSGFNFCIFK
ncbi:unnamed protein product [Acanthoscelides obtectus]|uniref:Uncharacterized protein n=1 Tax=Acanthoscelides obtectus TaxID=200917 RepID=A0A9P0L657_ACAOB|nr:unnamed protein product [Acanthoscelides obtectus]CAH1991613.1 unnamed protein product [Acanthoscelides obtectus]CAK1646649.1 hypothetical protein AOBTE_LOCUS14783 [Acanthoscelides obtectus]CAK1646892.1 hypothetical protein AOBTE_LOCUS14922 [Acanthoscelides obtectus]